MEIQERKPSKGIAVLGFFMTFIMVLFLIVGGILMSVKTSILSGGDINEILENTNIYGTITDVVVTEISENTEDAGLSKEAISEVFSEEVFEDAAKTMTDAIRNEEKIDLTEVKDQCMDVVVDVSEEAIDTIFDEIKSSSDVVSIDVLKQNATLQQLESDYNVDVTTVISDYVEQAYGSTTVDISEIDFDKAKTEAKETLHDTVIPTIEETVDEYIVKVNDVVNEQLQEVNEEYDISEAINLIEKALGIVSTITIVTMVIAGVMAVVQILVYRKSMNKGFRNISIAVLLSGIVIVTIGILINVIKGIVLGQLPTTGASIEKAITEFVESNINAVGGQFTTIGIVYIVVAVVLLVVAIVLKKKLAANDKTGFGQVA